MVQPAMPAGEGPAWDEGARLSGTLHVLVAFDWGEEIDLAKAQELVPSRPHVLARRPRTPPSIAYRPAPLRLQLGDVTLQLAGLGEVQATAEALLFDFAAVSVSLRVPFELPPVALASLAGRLAEAVLSDQAATYRTELLELIIIALIVFEIVMAFLGHS